MQKGYIVLLIIISFSFVQSASAQIMVVNSTTPCFLNYTAGVEMWRNCGVTTDWLETFMLPWQYATGGYFSMFLVAILATFSYIKYHKVAYPLLIGTMVLPISWFLFPSSWLNFAIIFAIVAIGFTIIHILIRQTKEYSG